MGLKTCVWCEAQISDRVARCPKCAADLPFDVAHKLHLEREAESSRIRAEQSKNDLAKASSQICICPDCGFRTTVGTVTGRNSHPCPTCGNPDIRPHCKYCEDRFQIFDKQRREFVCINHYITTCTKCGKNITDEKRVVNSNWDSWAGVHAVHKGCTWQEMERVGKLQGLFFTVIILLVIIGSCALS